MLLSNQIKFGGNVCSFALATKQLSGQEVTKAIKLNRVAPIKVF